MVPFYERMSNKDRELTENARVKEKLELEKRQKLAAYVDGEMALSTLKLDDYDRINAYRALNEAKSRQDAEA